MRSIRSALALAVAAASVSIMSTPVAAAAPQAVTATFQTVFAGGAHGTFNAIAPLPTSGSFVDSNVNPAINGGVVHVTRVLTSPNGTVDATWTAFFIGPGALAGYWVITGGTGAFANLQAEGTTSIALNFSGGALETWQGTSP